MSWRGVGVVFLALIAAAGIAGTLFFYNRAVEYQAREVRFHTDAVMMQKELRELRAQAATVKEETPLKVAKPVVRVVEKPVMVDGELIRLSREIVKAWKEGRQNDARTLAEKAAPLARRFRIVCDGPLGEEVWRDSAGAVEIPREAGAVYYFAEGR